MTQSSISAANQEASYEYRLRWFDFDCFGHLRPTTILDLFQDVATMQAIVMGIGYEDMHAKGAFWAVTRIRYEVIAEPTYHSIVRVSTWPYSPSRFSFQRDYEMRDEAGNLLIKATSEWVVIELESRKFARVDDFFDGPLDFLEKRTFDRKPKKIRMPDEENISPYTSEVHFTDIDVNGHVNNSRYPGFVIDALDPKEEFVIKSLQIDYRHELRADAPFTIRGYRDKQNIVTFGYNDEESVAFGCSIELA